MKKQLLFLILAFALMFAFAACGGEAAPTEEETVIPEEAAVEEPFTQEEIDAATAVVNEYVRAVNARDREAVFATVTEWLRADNVIFWERDETIAMENITCDPNNTEREFYVSDSGRGSENGTALENVIVLSMDFITTYPDGTTDEKPGWEMFLIRENAESPWLIDDQGY